MAIYALQNKRVRECQIYLTGLLLWPGKVHISNEPIEALKAACCVGKSTVYTSLNWLEYQGWIGNDKTNGWLFFRGLDHIHQIEGWKYSRAALMKPKDIHTIKAFFIGSVLASLVYSGIRGTGTDRKRRRSAQSRFPVSLSVISKLLNVSEKTAFNYRKLAQKYQYIKSEPNLQQVDHIGIDDIRQMKFNDIEAVKISLFGSTQYLTVSPKQFKSDKGKIFVQLPNFITPNVLIKKRKVKRWKALTPTG